MCGVKASAEQKQKLEEMMLELLELCREKEFYCVHDNVEDLIGMGMNTMILSINLKSQRLDKEKQEVKNIIEQATKRKTRITASKHYSKKKSDEVIKSSVKNLVPIPSESEVTSDNESECDVPVNDESSPIFTTFSNPLFDCNNDFTSSDDKSLSNEDVPMEIFKVYSNPLFDDEEIISTKIDSHYFNAKSNILESLLNRDTLIDSSPKFDYLLEEFSGELAHIDPILPEIKEADFDLEEEIRLVENLSDSHMEEIDLFLDMDDLMSPGIKNEDYDSEGDIYFLEEFLSNDPIPLPENESYNFDHHDDSSFPRPPPKPQNVEIFDPGIFIEVQSERLLSREEFSISFIRDPLYLVFDTLLPFSSENKDKVFKPSILSYLVASHRDKTTSDFFENPMMMYGGDIPLLDVPYLHFYLH
nr:hypothetical protein [Tanacetum cinerariifolium]